MATTVEVYAAQNRQGTWLEAHARFATYAEAAEFAAQFPKAIKVRATTVSCANPDDDYAIIRFHLDLRPDEVNGGFNETGVKRYRSFRAKAEALGAEIEWTTPYTNSISEAELEEQIR